MTIVQEICHAISRNPRISRVIVSSIEREMILLELGQIQMIKPSPRPTYGPPFGAIDRLLWDMLKETKKKAAIQIMGRQVVCG